MDKAKLEAVWESMKVADIAAMHGTTEQSVYHWARKYGLPSRLQLVNRDAPLAGDPSPEQIEERAAVIRMGWSDEERQRRVVGVGSGRQSGLRVYETSKLFGRAARI